MRKIIEHGFVRDNVAIVTISWSKAAFCTPNRKNMSNVSKIYP
jgi:hypothetical protein